MIYSKCSYGGCVHQKLSRLLVAYLQVYQEERPKTLAQEVLGEVQPFEDICKLSSRGRNANATPIGMHPNTNRILVATDTLEVYQLVFDAVYIPKKTQLLMDAEAIGTIAVSGVEMFLRQAMGQFSLFTGQEG